MTPDHEQNQSLLAEAAAYFQSRPGLGRLLQELIKKYRSLGRLGGVITLDALAGEEKRALEEFLRQRLPSGRYRLPAQAFGKVLAETRFAALDPVRILAAWQKAPLYSKAEEQSREKHRYQDVLDRLLRQYPQPACQLWLQAVRAGEASVRPVQAAWRRDACFLQHIRLALAALGQLPEHYRKLPVFAQQVCGNPHALDIDSPAGSLFLNGLRYLRLCDTSDNAWESGRSAVEETSELLYSFRLLREDIMNYVTCFGLAAFDQKQEFSYWREAAQTGAPLNAPLREIVRVARFCPALLPVREKKPGQREFIVFVVENSGVFSALLDEMTADWKVPPLPPLVCLQGQLKLAAWTLLDRLVDSGALLYYAGDFDPEGLQIAEKLLLRYPGRVQLWRMSPADYWQANPSQTIEPLRLAKLQSIQEKALAVLAKTIADRKLAAYQETLLDKLLADIKAAELWGKSGNKC